MKRLRAGALAMKQKVPQLCLASDPLRVLMYFAVTLTVACGPREPSHESSMKTAMQPNASALSEVIGSVSPTPALRGAESGTSAQTTADSHTRVTRAPLPPGTLSAQFWEDGWISLFDGETLFGWQAASRANWHVEQGAIVVSEGEKGLLCTSVPFSDYELHVEFNADRQTNSGVFLRTKLQPVDPRLDCYELNIAPADNPFPTGSFVGRKKVNPDGAAEGWHAFDVTCQDNSFVVRLDGNVVLEYRDERPIRRGLIGLQYNEGRIAFRNIRLRPLGMTSLFDGRSLDGWTTYPNQPVKVDVDSGVLRVVGGRGMVESKKLFADFILQLECRTGGPNMNSGVFFRCIPGELMNGYECQIHNGYQQGDRRRPIDQGTGAIFRRQPARVVAADDQEWFGLTIVAAGPHLATWVNGLQVTDWTDERPDSPNPRQGRRLAPGSLMLQGHDPTTRVEFRNLRIMELPGPDS